jgi:hypothetical protein
MNGDKIYSPAGTFTLGARHQRPSPRCIPIFLLLCTRTVPSMKQLVLLGLSATLCTGMLTPIAIATEIFGRDGRDGTTGRSGRNGTTGTDSNIRATNIPQSLNHSGTDGEPGESGDSGESASDCYQPRDPAHDLRGANGGDGGSGGNGGNGGNGGSATIFYSNIAQLKNLQLNNPGGRGGRSGRGGQAGRGCIPDRTYWTIAQCEWVLMRRRFNDPNATWQPIDHRRDDCEDERDHHRNRPRDRQNNHTHEFRWEFRGVVGHNSYRAAAGRDGTPGQDGIDGSQGQFGNIYLVPGDSIPTEVLSHLGPIANINGKPIDLVKNNWLTQSGLAQYLAAGSNVPDHYQQLQTVRHQFQVDWQTHKSFSLLGNPQISVTIDAAGDLDFGLPGHLEYRQTHQGVDQRSGEAPRTQIMIVNGIAPDRLKQIKFRGFEQFQDARNFALIDEGKLLKEIARLGIKVSVSDPTQTIEETYDISDRHGNIAASGNITALGDIYKIQLSDKFTPLLKSGTPLIYNFQIQQTTRSGANYRSRMRVKQVVDQITFPKVEYQPVNE